MKVNTRKLAFPVLIIFSLLMAACSAPGGGAAAESERETSGKLYERRIQVRFSSTSEWNNLVIRNAEVVQGYEVLETWGETTRAEVSENGFALDQESANAEAGIEIGALAEYVIAGIDAAPELAFVLEKGELGVSRIEITDVTGPESFTQEAFTHRNTDLPNDFNRTRFTVLLDGKPPEKVETAELREGVGGILFHNGNILTMDEENPSAEAIFIEYDKITAVGDHESVMALAGTETIMVDLEGRTLMPGFVDGHAHSFDAFFGRDFAGGQDHLLARGITTTAELYVDESFIQEIMTFDETEGLRMRVSLYPVHVNNCGEDWGDWYWPDYPPLIEDGAMLQIPGIKIFSDGGSCNLPARSFEYPIGGFGALYHEADELAGIIIEAQERGYQVAIHGLGDRAITVNLDALAIALDGQENIWHHRSEHNALLRDDMLARYSEIDLVNMIFGYFPACRYANGEFFPVPEEYDHMEWRWRELLDTNPGARFAWHSDTPAIFGSPEPFWHLFGFTTRREVWEDGTICEPPDWALDDLLMTEEALPMMTINSAYALRREHEIGSLEEGKLADLILLSENPLVVAGEELRNIQVLMTMVGGQVQYCLPENPELCF